jgi:hypothetical protein
MTYEARAWQIASAANSLGQSPRCALRFAGLPVAGEPTWTDAVRRIAAALERHDRKVAA